MFPAGGALIEEALGEVERRGIKTELRELVGAAQQREAATARRGRSAARPPLLGQASTRPVVTSRARQHPGVRARLLSARARSESSDAPARRRSRAMTSALFECASQKQSSGTGRHLVGGTPSNIWSRPLSEWRGEASGLLLVRRSKGSREGIRRPSLARGTCRVILSGRTSTAFISRSGKMASTSGKSRRMRIGSVDRPQRGEAFLAAPCTAAAPGTARPASTVDRIPA
jgi:hypothetical protein